MTQDPETVNNDKSFMLFGRDISKIPCFRNSLLYGIGGGLSMGLGYFMFTSRTLKAANFAVYSFSVITLGYWIRCRYEYSVKKFEMMRIQELLRQRALMEGTEQERVMEEKLGTKPVEV